MKKLLLKLLKFGGIVLLVVGFVVLVVFMMRYGTGFEPDDGRAFEITETNGRISRIVEKEPAKDLWDWMQLFLVPVVITAATLWVSFTQNKANQDLARQQKEVELELADRRTKEDREIADRRIEEDRKIAERRIVEDRHNNEDDQRENMLQTYLDRMSELIKDPEFRKPLEVGEKNVLHTIARSRTLTVLERLDGNRKASVIRFLYEAKLIISNSPLISLQNANLANVNLEYAKLANANLEYANLEYANLEYANLEYCILLGTDLSYANLSYTKIKPSIISTANLASANLTHANLEIPNFINVNLEGANGYSSVQSK